MARLFPLSFSVKEGGLAVALGLGPLFFTSVQADAPTPTPMPSQVSSATSQPKAPQPTPNPQDDVFNRYGKIVSLNNELAHPLKLTMPYPGVGEVKIPSQDEIKMREKLEELAILSDADIRTQLEQWPPYSKMSLKDEGAMLQRIQDFRDRRTKIAMDKMHQMGLNTLPPDQQARFEKEYWAKQLEMDRELAQKFDPVVKDEQQKMKEELFREFSTPVPSGPMAQTTPKPSSPPAQSKPSPSPAPAQVQAKPSPTSVPPPPGTNTSPPVAAQAPVH